MKKSFLFIFIFIVLVAFVYQTNFQTEKKSEKFVKNDPHPHAQVIINKNIFDAYISDTEKLREKGLSGFSGLENNQAMLFIFPNADIYGFWMKGMLFSIDILWLDDDFKIISLEKNVSPNTFPKIFFPKKPAKYVIELRAGISDILGAREGEKVSIVGGK